MASRRARALAAAACLAVALAGCTKPAAPKTTARSTTTATPTVASRDFTVGTTEKVTVADPAAVGNDSGSIVAYNVFQRLMTANPGDTLLKPDAASDCIFRTPTQYECKLREGIRFHNNDPLTSADVKFSILRAYRLAVPGSTSASLAALDTIETPSELVVRFNLKWPDTQFGLALAAPAASIVDAKIYDADLVRAPNLTEAGSGPYQLTNVATNGVLFTRYENYVGSDPGAINRIVLAYYPDSAGLEDAMTRGQVEVVWKGLSAAALKRLASQSQPTPSAPVGPTKAGYLPIPMPGTRMRVLAWQPGSGQRLNADLRAVVAGALQEDRTLDSLLPPGVDGHVAAFPIGGKAVIPTPATNRMRVTLGFDPTSPDIEPLARQVRDRLEAAGLSAQLLPGDANADLVLGNANAWAASPEAWLLAYTSAPLPGSAAKVQELDQRWRGATDKPTIASALAEIQKQAAADDLVLPISQDDDVAYLAPGVSIVQPRFGPGYQLALWALRK